MRLFWVTTTAAIFVQLLAPLLVQPATLPAVLQQIEPYVFFVGAIVFGLASLVLGSRIVLPKGLRDLKRLSGGDLEHFKLYYRVGIVIAVVSSEIMILCAAIGAIMVGIPNIMLPCVLIAIFLNVMAFPNLPRALQIVGERNDF